MKYKFIKILFINIFLIVFIIISAELYFQIKEYKMLLAFVNPNERVNLTLKDHAVQFYRHLAEIYFNDCLSFYSFPKFREPSGLEYSDKPAIILFGCSYTNGLNLEYEDTFGFVLSKQLNRPVYNLGICGGGPRDFLKIFQDSEIINKVVRDFAAANIQFVIYTYIPDHMRRIDVNLLPCVPDFKLTETKNFIECKNNIFKSYFKRSSLYNKISNHIYYKKDANEIWHKFCSYIQAIKKEINSRFSYQGNKPKLIILAYEMTGDENWEDLEDENTYIINIDDLAEIKRGEVPYAVWEGDDHPSGLVWRMISPKLAGKLKELGLD